MKTFSSLKRCLAPDLKLAPCCRTRTILIHPFTHYSQSNAWFCFFFFLKETRPAINMEEDQGKKALPVGLKLDVTSTVSGQGATICHPGTSHTNSAHPETGTARTVSGCCKHLRGFMNCSHISYSTHTNSPFIHH